MISTSLFSVVYTAVVPNGAWNDAATWGGGGTPGPGDDAIITGGITVRANQTVTINTLTIGSTTSNGNLVRGIAGRTLTVTGAISIIPSTVAGAGLNSLDVRDGSIVCASISSGLSGANNIDCAIDIRDGVLTVSGDISMDPDRRRSDINFYNQGNGTLDVGGNIVTGTLRMRTISGQSGSRIINANSLTVGTTITVNHNGVGDVTGPAQIDCPWILTNNRTVNVVGDGNDATEDLVISGVISDGGGDYRLIKSGDGSLTLSAANTFTDDVRLTAGKLNINNAQALGLGDSNDPLDIRGGIIDNTSGAPITISRAAGSMSYIISADFTFAGTNELNWNTGAVDFTTDATITCEGAAKLVIGGVINEPGQNVIKAGAGELELGTSSTLLNNLNQTGGDLVFGASNLTVNDLTVTSGNFTPPTAAGVLLLGGDFTNNGTLISNSGSVEFTNAGNQVVSGSSAINIFNVETTGGGQVQLETDLSVSNTLTMTSGNFDLNSNTLTLGTSDVSPGTLVHAKTAGSGTVYDGFFTRFVAASPLTVGNLAGFFPFGTNGGKYVPLELTSAAGPGTGGSITVTHGEASFKDPLADVAVVDGASTIFKRNRSFWTISTNAIAGGTYELNIGGNGFGTVNTVTDLRAMLASSVVGTAGVNAGTTAQPEVKRTGLSLADLGNTFFIGSINATDSPLPVELLSFSANYFDGKVDLFWETAVEINNDYFIVQKSNDGINFYTVSMVKGAGNTIDQQDYQVEDMAGEIDGKLYYRLKQVDFDGSINYSNAIVVLTEGSNLQESFNLYPNPVSSGIVFLQSNSELEIEKIEVYSMDGQMVFSNSARFHGIVKSIDVSLFSPGSYLCKITSDHNVYTSVLVVR